MKLISNISIMTTMIIMLTSCSIKETDAELWSKTKVLQSQEKHEEALETLKKLLDNYPKSEYASEARFMLADGFANIKNDYPKAVVEYRRIILEFPDSNLAPKAQFMIGYIYANYVKDYDKAQAAYLEFKEKYEGNDLSEAVEFELQYLGKDLDDITELKKITGTD